TRTSTSDTLYIVSSSSKLDLQHSTAHGTSGFSQREHARTAPTVLLADDHIELLQAVARMLEGKFEVVATAKDGRRALELAHNLSPDVLLLDISMPVREHRVKDCEQVDRKSTRLNSSHEWISYAVFCLKKK